MLWQRPRQYLFTFIIRDPISFGHITANRLCSTNEGLCGEIVVQSLNILLIHAECLTVLSCVHSVEE